MKLLVGLLLCMGLHVATAQPIVRLPQVEYLDSAFEKLPSATGARYRRETVYTADSMAGTMRTYYVSGQLLERANFEQASDNTFYAVGDSFDEIGRRVKHTEHNRRFYQELLYYPTGQLKRREYQGLRLFGRKRGQCFAPNGSRIPYFEYEVPPRYPEGNGKPQTVLKIIRRSLHYPEDVLREHIKGRVFIAFTVAESGDIENVRAIKPLMPSMDAEAVRVVQHLKRFEPSRLDGKPRKVNYIFPIEFRLE